MKLTTGILAMAITVAAVGALAPQAGAQNPDAIDNARSVAKSLQQKQAIETNEALDAAGVPAKPAPGAPAPAVKPAVIPGANPAAKPAAPAPAAKAPATKAPATKAAATKAPAAAAKPAAASAENQLQRVNVVPGVDTIKIEISSSHAVTGKVSKMNSPARVVVELPETVIASAQNKIPVGSAGVKGVRIGMDGKNPPTTSVVVDLEKALAYELTQGPTDKLVLTLHTQGGAPVVAKSEAKSDAKAATKSNPAPAPVPVKTVATAVQPKTAVAKTASPAAKPQPAAAKPAVTKAAVVVAKADAKPAGKKPGDKKQAEKKQADTKQADQSGETKAATAVASAPAAEASKIGDNPKPKQEDKKWAMSGKRDPFFSPVVQQGGSGCSTGKKCLEIGNINLRGVVKSDSGFIAVVTNNLNKAYFLRENDPVFNGYVVRITGDSVVFQETVQDKLGKPFTREVVKRIFTPAV